MAKQPIFGKDPEKISRLLSIGEDEQDLNEVKEDVVDFPISSNSITSKDEIIERLHTKIEGYRIIKVLGEGGMGIVYLAEQQYPVQRPVALKIIKPGMDSKRVMARFEAEQQALARLDHPNIAHVYGGGTTELDRPYFVMEYIEGIPITDYCDHHKLTIKDRLGLFVLVCQAVQHAHQKGIIHRDIKPSNILVSMQEEKAVPKIIDFGVAKAIAQPLTERTLLTEDSQLLGTPEYMSPEQADMPTEDIDTRSDIYSLGVLLYVLLTGVLPFDSDTLREGGLDHVRKVIRETDPKTPSTRLSKLGEEALKIAEVRNTEINALTKYLKKELEWIPLKAMRKERTERYCSASELANDIDNYLSGIPLLAGPPTARYRLKKFLRRHKVLVSGIAAVLVVSVIGTIVSVTFALGQARARAESEIVTHFLGEDVLHAVSSIKGREATVADVLHAASKNLEGKFKDQPLVEAQIRWYLGAAYRELFDYKAAILHLERSYQLRREYLGERNWLTTLAKNYLAISYERTGRYSEAEQLFDELIKGPNTENINRILTWKGNLACVYVEQGRYEDAERFFLTSLETKTPWWESWAHGENPYLMHLADVYLYLGQYEEAELLFNQFMDDRGDSALGSRILPHLGYLYMDQERYDEAEELFTKGIEYGNREFPGKDHAKTLSYMNGLAVLRTKQKQYDVAERLFSEVLEARNLKLGEDHPNTLETKNDLAMAYKELARYEEAERLFLEALEGRRLKLGDSHPHTLESWKSLIDLYEAWGKSEKAEEWRAKLLQTEAVDE